MASDGLEIHLRALEEGDLDVLARFDIDPALSEPFEWRGFRDPHARRRRWEQDGYLGTEDSMLAVSTADGIFAGFVSWNSLTTSGPQAVIQIGILLWPEHRGRGIGSRAQQLLADYLFSTTTANRIEASTEVDNIAENSEPSSGRALPGKASSEVAVSCGDSGGTATCTHGCETTGSRPLLRSGKHPRDRGPWPSSQRRHPSAAPAMGTVRRP